MNKRQRVVVTVAAFVIVVMAAAMHGDRTVSSQGTLPGDDSPGTPTVEPTGVAYLPAAYKAPPFAKPYPPDESIRRSLNTYLTWNLIDPKFQGATFTIYLEANDSTPDEVAASNYGGQVFDPPTFAENTEYFWQIVADDAAGNHAESDIWSFKTDYFLDPPEVGSMVDVPAGPFLMGCDPNNSGAYPCSYVDVPLHEVYLDAFQIDKFEVTNKEYRACTDVGACNLPRKFISNIDEPYFYNADYDYFPVMYVSHWDAEDYCSWVGKRLPTEAEWEKAARGAVDTRPWPWGSEHYTCDTLNRCGDFHPERVDDFRGGQSPYGAVNLAGNVFEWVQDHYYDYYYTISPYANPVNTEQLQDENVIYFSIRGGSYHDNWWYSRTFHRKGGHWGDTVLEGSNDKPLFRSFRVGFRCASSGIPE